MLLVLISRSPSERCRLRFSLIKVHALRQKPTYTHASSCPSSRRSWGSSAAGGGGEDGAARGGPWGASPWRSSLRSGRSSRSCDSSAAGAGAGTAEGEEEAGKSPCLAPSSKLGAPL